LSRIESFWRETVILTGRQIRELGIVEPHVPRTEISSGVITTSFGESFAGYDLRLNMMDGATKIGDETWILKPGEFTLASALERFNMPNDILGIVHDKSTWARKGIAVQNTVIEPGWRGYLTLEITNHGSMPVVFCKGVGICQVVFHRLEEPAVPYAGKYQDQGPEPTPAK